MNYWHSASAFCFFISCVVAWSNPALAAYDMAAACFFLLLAQNKDRNP